MSGAHPRPLLQPSFQFDWLIGADDPGVAHRLAQETSWALLDRVRSHGDAELVERVIAIADTELMDDIAELWSASGTDTLAGMLWRLYLVRRIARGDAEGAAYLFQRGVETLSTIDPVIAGVPIPVEPSGIIALIDDILRGVFSGDLADAFERAAAYARLVSAGAVTLADERESADPYGAGDLTNRAASYAALGDDLRQAAHRWRHGRLA